MLQYFSIFFVIMVIPLFCIVSIKNTYPGNQGEVARGIMEIGTFPGVMELHVLRICVCWGGEVERGDSQKPYQQWILNLH